MVARVLRAACCVLPAARYAAIAPLQHDLQRFTRSLRSAHLHLALDTLKAGHSKSKKQKATRATRHTDHTTHQPHKGQQGQKRTKV
jgi:hypothetical protein